MMIATKLVVAKRVNTLGGLTRYSGKERTMYVGQQSTPYPAEAFDIIEQVTEEAEKVGANIPFSFSEKRDERKRNKGRKKKKITRTIISDGIH